MSERLIRQSCHDAAALGILCQAENTSCINGIEAVRKNSQADDRFERKDTKAGKWMFTLKASNGRVIGTSEIYESEKDRESGIASVINNAAKAKLDDQVAYD